MGPWKQRPRPNVNGQCGDTGPADMDGRQLGEKVQGQNKMYEGSSEKVRMQWKWKPGTLLPPPPACQGWRRDARCTSLLPCCTCPSAPSSAIPRALGALLPLYSWPQYNTASPTRCAWISRGCHGSFSCSPSCPVFLLLPRRPAEQGRDLLFCSLL